MLSVTCNSSTLNEKKTANWRRYRVAKESTWMKFFSVSQQPKAGRIKRENSPSGGETPATGVRDLNCLQWPFFFSLSSLAINGATRPKRESATAAADLCDQPKIPLHQVCVPVEKYSSSGKHGTAPS